MKPLTGDFKRSLRLGLSCGVLRPIEADDVGAEYVAGLNNPVVNRYLVKVRETVQTPELVKAYVDGNHHDPHAVLFGVFRKGRTAHSGTVRLHGIDVAGEASLGICLFDREVWGRGIASEAIRVVTQWGFETLALEAVNAAAYLENVASWKAFVNAGYSQREDVNAGYQIDGRDAVIRWLVARRPGTRVTK